MTRSIRIIPTLSAPRDERMYPTSAIERKGPVSYVFFKGRGSYNHRNMPHLAISEYPVMRSYVLE